MWVYLDGRVVPRAEARIAVDDAGFRVGDGAFTTLRVYGGRPFRLEAHLQRLLDTLDWLGIALPEDAGGLARAVRSLIERDGRGDLRLRISVSRGRPGGESTRVIEASALAGADRGTKPPGLSAVLHAPAHGLGPLAGRKTLSYLPYVLARRAATAAGADEAILVDPRGRVIEGAYSNVFTVVGGEVVTPPLADGALPGVAREVVLGLLSALEVPAREATLTAAALAAADEVWVTSSVVEVAAVIQLDGAPIGDGEVGPIARRARAAYRELVSAGDAAP